MLIEIHEPGQTPLPHGGAASIGIDLGTTNSLVAISNKGQQEVIAEKNGKILLPSVVAYLDDGRALVGEKAEKETGAIRSVKRLMGKSTADIKAQLEMLPYEIDETSEENIVSIKAGKRTVTAIEVSSEILKELKRRAETELDNKVDRAVITVPAYFDDAARAATKAAAKLAGLEVLRLINEPTAAAVAYGLDNKSEGIYAIYDLGGGTFDISLLKMEKGVFQVLATGGDTELGGDDFDNEIVKYFLKKYFKNMKANSEELSVLLSAARVAKEYLTENKKGKWKISSGGKETECVLDIKTLNSLIEPYVDRTIKICNAVLEDSGVEKKDIKGVVLVGGSTRIALVKEKVKEVLGKKPLDDVDPDKVVAIGAAIQAEALTQGSDSLLLDVTPLSLGIETMGGIMESIIPRNTPIPTSHSHNFTTYQDGQTGMKIHVLQGEREMVDQCRSLAQFELLGIPPMQAGAAVIQVVFSVDADGLLTVSAKETTTGTEQKIEVKPSYGLPAEKIEQMLEESMKHAREDITRKLLAQSKIDAEITVNAIKSALNTDSDLLDDESLKKIEEKIELVGNLIKGKDRDIIDYEVKELEKICALFVEKRINKTIGSALKGQKINELTYKKEEKA